MRTSLVLTIIGDDKPGIVEQLSDRILATGANWEESRMARLGGKFAGLLRVTVDRARADALAAELTRPEAGELTIVVEQSGEQRTGWYRTVRLELLGTIARESSVTSRARSRTTASTSRNWKPTSPARRCPARRCSGRVSTRSPGDGHHRDVARTAGSDRRRADGRSDVGGFEQLGDRPNAHPGVGLKLATAGCSSSGTTAWARARMLAFIFEDGVPGVGLIDTVTAILPVRA